MMLVTIRSLIHDITLHTPLCKRRKACIYIYINLLDIYSSSAGFHPNSMVTVL